MGQRRWTVWARRSVIVVVLALLAGLSAVWLYLRGSLPQLDGTVAVRGLQATVTVARDGHGVPEVRGTNRLDVAYAVGYLHAQERYFQMDLLRRAAAGELSELFGAKALPLDRQRRLHRLRARAEDALTRLGPDERAFIDRYVQGVNNGLQALRARPFEYALVGATPRPWQAADSLLVVGAMYFDLQDGQEPRELARGWLRDHSDAAQLAFLLPESTAWDAPLDAAGPPQEAPIPARAPAWWGHGGQEPRKLAGLHVTDSVGSNNYALAGSRTAHGAAIVSDDMHLGLQLPNIWYRLSLRYPDGQGGERRIVGVSLPGAPPLVIAGSNGHVAWSFTNSYGDYLDLVALDSDPARPDMVRTPAGWERPVVHEEAILVKGAPPERLRVRETSLGPIRAAGGRQYALHWIAHDPAALNLNHLKLEQVTTLEQALAVANIDGIPAQNFVAGDERGNIGWTIAGILPRRTTASEAATFPLHDAPTWSALLPPAAYPRVVNPPAGQISTANSRQLMGAGAQLLGDGGFDLGARASQLRDTLHGLGDKTDVPAAFRAALDDRALFAAPWRTRALATLDAAALRDHPQRAEFRRLLETSWDGRASVDSVGYRLARNTMWALQDILFGGADRDLKLLDERANMAAASRRWPAVVARLLDEKPAGWLPPGYADWKQVELAAIDLVIANLTRDGKRLAEATWGERNRVAIAHPFVQSVPLLRPFLAPPADPQPGDSNMPRVAGPKFGQSERLTVSPGHEEEGLFNMPGGQSGHPLSPYYLAGHDDWVQGKPQPLLPGKPLFTLVFQPAR